MAEERLRRNLDIALDPGPDFPSHLWLSRTMAALEKDVRLGIRVRGTRSHLGSHLTVRMAAAMTLVVVLVAASGVFFALHLAATRTVPSNTPKPGAIIAPLTASWAWFFTAKDGAVQLEQTDPENPSNVLAERLLITHDGGNTWFSTRMQPAGSVRLIWVDPAHIVYVGESAIQTSADGGLSWTSTHGNSGLATRLDPGSTYFIDDQEGWTLQNNSVVYGTTDSGAHWQKLATVGSDPTAPVAQFKFTDPLHGFMAGHSQDGVGRFFRTLDGGKSWRLIQLPVPASGWPVTDGTVDAPTFFGEQGFTLYTGPLGYMSFTSDGGSTWSSPRPDPNYPASVRASFINLTDGWTVASTTSTGVEYRTVDGGISWQQVRYTLNGLILRSVAPVGGDVLWGTASAPRSGVLYAVRSTDGGVSWSLVKTPIP
jgi:photosystem II stability/assembly factor-like uncharacterized protein